MKNVIFSFFLLAIAMIAIPAPTYAKTSLKDELNIIESEWARLKYIEPMKQEKLKGYLALDQRAKKVIAEYPQSAEAKIWDAIVLAGYADSMASVTALPKVDEAKALLEEAIKTNPSAMNGYAQMTLGALYFKVPGWPISFGSDKKAEYYLKEALRQYPDGMDTNYWYGAFLLDDGRADESVPYLQKAMAAPVRGYRITADKGRQKEISNALEEAQKKLKKKSVGNS